MKPRERWLALLNGEKPDRIPTDYWATDEVTSRLMKELRCSNIDELYDKLHIDGVHQVHARNTGLLKDNEDHWGIRYRKINYGEGSYQEAVFHPLAGAKSVKDVHDFPWPDPNARDWAGFKREVEAIDGKRIVRCGNFEPFLLYCLLRGMEKAMMDLIQEPDIAEASLGYIFDYYFKITEKMFSIGKGKIDITYIAEDLGSQHGLLMSLEQIRRFILPNQKRMADLARSYGIKIFYHTDGAAREAIPDLLDVTGIDILNPIQWRCPGMEREGLVRDFGDRVIFHGAMDNQQTLANGSVKDVENEVKDNIRIFSKARWICAPCHNIQPVTTTENIIAMYSTIHENGNL